MARRLAFNQSQVGSIPIRDTTICRIGFLVRSSALQADKTGSIPVCDAKSGGEVLTGGIRALQVLGSGSRPDASTTNGELV
jgi:hypothetical protein